MKLDTTRIGLNSVWKIYQLAIIELLAKTGPLGSGKIHETLTRNSIKISRASVIQFLNSLERQGFASFTEKSGKGGFAKIFKLEASNLRAFHEETVIHFMDHLKAVYSDMIKIEWEIIP